MKELAKSFYVINNIEKASRIINVSFTTNTPENYVDCGDSYRTYTQGKISEAYSYAVAEASSFKLAGGVDANQSFRFTHYIQRKASLDGRINIYVAPFEDKTQLSVNTRYILTVTVNGITSTENISGQQVYSKPIPSQSETATFSTNQPNQYNWGTSQQPLQVTCLSKGKLEQDILTLVK